MSKTLIIFDFNHTMIDCNTLYEQCRLAFSEEETEKVKKMDREISFEYTIRYFYDKLKENKKTIEDINMYIDTIKLSKGFKELIQYLNSYRDKYELIIVSSDIDYPIKRILSNESLLECFNSFLGLKSELCEDKLIKFKPLEKCGCKNCEPNGCKSFLVKEYIKNFGNEKKYKNFIFVCDGFNDYCLGYDLKENDILMPRNNYELYKRLYEKGDYKNLKCKIFNWNDGYNILDYFKKNNS